jgi:hypothetical protein
MDIPFRGSGTATDLALAAQTNTDPSGPVGNNRLPGVTRS